MTKTKTTPCRGAFDASRASRGEHPLSSGRYKLEEAHSDVLRMRKTVVSIGDAVSGRTKHRSGQLLGCCSTDKKAYFLKRLPQTVARLQGGKILPGIAALDGDGVSQAVVRDLTTSVDKTALALLQECDTVHSVLAAGIQREYDAMRHGSSYALDLLDQVMDLTVPFPMASKARPSVLIRCNRVSYTPRRSLRC